MTDFTTPEAQQHLKDLLREKVCLVKFTKVDGSVRDLYCTLNPFAIDEDTKSKSEKAPRAPSTETLAVYDTINFGWRSFRYDSIIEVKETT
jgi:hypothetical protein